MKLQITAKKMQVPQTFNEYADKKLTKLDRFFGDEADAKLTVSTLKDDIIIELTVLQCDVSVPYTLPLT